MDTTRDITYRGFLLNDSSIQDNITGGGGIGSGITGCVVDTFDVADVDVVQWTEKRSQSDGLDTGDPTLGARRIRMAGVLYGRTRALLFDALWDLRAACNPVLAQREEPLDHGYRPLLFSVPTNRIDDYPEGIIDLQVKALPRTILHLSQDDAQGGRDADSLAMPWQATFMCKDPAILALDPIEVDFDTYNAPVTTGVTSVAATDIITKVGHGLVAGDRITFYALTGGAGLALGTTYYVIATNLTTDTFMVSTTAGGATVNHTTNITAASYVKSTTVSGTWTNRGTYLGKFNALVVVGAGGGTISATVGDSVFTVTVPASTGSRTIRIKDDKVITFEENSVEVTQMSAITFSGDTTWPLIDPGDTPYSITFHGMGGLQPGGRMWFYEQHA